MRFQAISAFVVAAAAGSASAGVSLWDFNVFSRSTIGSSGQGYGSDFQGASAAVGNAYFSGFTVRGVANTSPSIVGGFYGGANFTLQGSVDHGGLYVAGNVNLNNASVAGDVHAGGNLGGAGGTVNGSAYLGGSKVTGNALNVTGALNTGQAYAAPIDLAAASTYFQNAGSYVAGLASNTSYTNNFGELVITTSGPLSVVNFALNDFQNAWGIRVVGAGTVLINVGGTNLTVNGKTWTYQNGASSSDTLLNFGQATNLTLNGSQTVNILAANAATNYTSGVITGDLVVGSLTGNGQVNWGGGFNGGSLVPAPAGFVTLMGFGALASQRRRR